VTSPFGVFCFEIWSLFRISSFEFRIESGFHADANRYNTCESADERLTAKLTVWAKMATQSDPRLAAVLAAWAALPETVKIDIVAMISDDGLLAVG